MRAPILILQAPSNCGSLSFTYGLSSGPLRNKTTGNPPDKWTEADSEKFDFASGHEMLGEKRQIEGRPVVASTLFRHPAARLVSEFNYVHGAYYDRHRLDGKIMGEKPELAIGGGNDALKPAAHDLKSWIAFVAETGTGSMVEWLLRWSGMGGHGDAPAYLRQSDWFARLTDWIDTHIEYPLITELIEESLFTVTRDLALPPPTPWIRLQPFKPKHSHVSGVDIELRNSIDQAIQADLALYDHYRRKFEERLRAFRFDDEFLEYKARCHGFDANMRNAFQRRDYTYLPAAIRENRALLRRYTILLAAAMNAAASPE